MPSTTLATRPQIDPIDVASPDFALFTDGVGPTPDDESGSCRMGVFWTEVCSEYVVFSPFAIPQAVSAGWQERANQIVAVEMYGAVLALQGMCQEARVPTDGNPADGPSREDAAEFGRRGARYKKTFARHDESEAHPGPTAVSERTATTLTPGRMRWAQVLHYRAGPKRRKTNHKRQQFKYFACGSCRPERGSCGAQEYHRQLGAYVSTSQGQQTSLARALVIENKSRGAFNQTCICSRHSDLCVPSVSRLGFCGWSRHVTTLIGRYVRGGWLCPVRRPDTPASHVPFLDQDV